MSQVLASALFLLTCGPRLLLAGSDGYYAGGLVGIATLSADARFEVSPLMSATSLYKPVNGVALHFFFGRHFSDYLSVQGEYGWNRNRLTLSSARFSAGAQDAYQVVRSSSQQSLFADLLLYFRNRRSFARPYLSAGTGLVHLRSTAQAITTVVGSPTLPPGEFTSTAPALRVAVGIDLAAGRGWAFRYSFSEAIRSNAISARLSPPGQRNLANFQNLFGVVKSW